jgi:diguanylate cyclase (GGDEF)-like protein
MTVQSSSLGTDEMRAPPAPPVPPMALRQPTEDLAPLGEALKDRAGDVLTETVARTTGSQAGQEVDAVVQGSFERISISSTMAVARWIAGEGIEVAVEAGRETWEIFAELAAHHAASLDEVTRRCFAWRNVMAEVLHESAAQLGSSPEALSQALSILQLSLEFSILRMCESFETERKRLSFLATHDPLTGLPNRTLIVDRVEQMLARSARSNKPVTALFIDLDNFKDINDTLGHATGDELLQAVTARLRGVIRGADALGRLGGDEFVVISEQLSPPVRPELIAERVLDALEHPFYLGTDKHTRVSVTASIGLAVGDRISAEELLRDADIAMYRAKWDGKSRYVVFEAGMQHITEHRVTLDRPIDIRVGKKTPARVGKTVPRSYYK